MNSLLGNISDISVSGKLSIIQVQVSQVVLYAIIIDTPETADYLKVGREVNVIFKESEVIIGKGINHEVSLRNKLVGQISSIESGELLSKVVVDTSVGNITSIITTNAVRNLDLSEGSVVTAMIKTNEIMLSQ